jgi:hypothetical protein
MSKSFTIKIKHILHVWTEFVERWVCRIMNLPNYEFVKLWVCQIMSLSNYEFVKLWVCWIMSLLYYEFFQLITRLSGNGLVPSSQTVRSLLRSPGQHNKLEKWIGHQKNGFVQLAFNLSNGVTDTLESRTILIYLETRVGLYMARCRID